jgi:transcriptional regulator GlxA family with amidase domain
VLAEIAEVAGLDAALAIAEKRGGTEVYIPAQANDDHWLVKTVGRAAADKLCRYFAFSPDEVSRRGNDKHHGTAVELPLGPRGSLAKVRSLVDRMIAEKKSINEIALAAGYTARGVHFRKAKARANAKRPSAQGRLF